MKIFSNKIFFLIIGILFIAVTGLLLLNYLLFSAPNSKSQKMEVFVVGLKTNRTEIIDKLFKQGFIRNKWAFEFALNRKNENLKIKAGGYYLSKNMNTWEVLNRLTLGPEMKWVVIPEGLRKEEIGEIMAKTLNWSEKDLTDWTDLYTRTKFDYIEGVYFPDTYLIPVSEKNFETAQRMINRFNEKFAPYFSLFSKKDIMWTTGLRLASIIQREAAGRGDMSLIAGILWNRLDIGMKLEVDATVQYARGKTNEGWWAPIKPEDKKIDYLYNTYKYKGMPPHPISNPGLDAIEAVLNPEETDCLYYLHDPNRRIHCAKTFKEHQENILKYL